MSPKLPWEFKPTEVISESIRGDKITRQDWYRTQATRHCFYTGVEATNSNLRTSKGNPPKFLHAIVLDYDLPLDAARVEEAIAKMKLKPSWIERSLGGNVRLVWTLEKPMLLESADFAVFIFQRLAKWLQAGLLPGLDESAASDPARLFCNGCNWRATGHGPIPHPAVQAFYVEAGREFQFKGTEGGFNIPLDVVEAELTKRYPNFSWPGAFEYETQGPSFWVEGSTSPMSAILKKDGMFTFAGHAKKPFFSWVELLGAEFCKEYESGSIAKATTDVFYDGRYFWRKFAISDRYASESVPDFTAHLKVDLRISFKPDKSGVSMGEKCLAHIRNHARVEGGAPFLFQPPGLVEYNGKHFVNTFKSTSVKPSGIPEVWGAAGQFPFLSEFIDGIFDPSSQLAPFLAWWRHLYKNALEGRPMPGQNIFLAGGGGVGKTLLNRSIVGKSVGGFTDARDYIMGGDSFGSDVFNFPIWSIDDETISDNEAQHRRFTSMVKKAAANQSFRYHKKFESPLIIPWMGRIIITLNLDESSSRTLPALDGTIMDKVSFFRCAEAARIEFPDRYELETLIDRELPHFLQWMLDWTPPAALLGETRYGVVSHHEGTLLDKAHQASQSAPFKELWIEALITYFKTHPDEKEWRGSVTKVMRTLTLDPMNENVVRSLRMTQVNRHLESLSREKVLNCIAVNGEHKTREWIFPRFVNPAVLPAAAVVESSPKTFVK